MWASGGAVFAGCVMLMIGVFQVLAGISAIAKDAIFLATNNYVYEFNTTVWGWIHLGLGALLAICGLGLLARMMWAVVAGIILALLSAIENFFFLPYYPIWSVVVIALDVFVIWSLATLAGRPEGPRTSATA